LTFSSSRDIIVEKGGTELREDGSVMRASPGPGLFGSCSWHVSMKLSEEGRESVKFVIEGISLGMNLGPMYGHSASFGCMSMPASLRIATASRLAESCQAPLRFLGGASVQTSFYVPRKSSSFPSNLIPLLNTQITKFCLHSHRIFPFLIPSNHMICSLLHPKSTSRFGN
jgi:hypothetical protein